MPKGHKKKKLPNFKPKKEDVPPSVEAIPKEVMRDVVEQEPIILSSQVEVLPYKHVPI